MPLTITVQGQDVMVVEEFVYRGSLIHSATRITSVTLPARKCQVPSLVQPCRALATRCRGHGSLPHEIEALQHVHLTNIPEWFGLLGSRT